LSNLILSNRVRRAAARNFRHGPDAARPHEEHIARTSVAGLFRDALFRETRARRKDEDQTGTLTAV